MHKTKFFLLFFVLFLVSQASSYSVLANETAASEDKTATISIVSFTNELIVAKEVQFNENESLLDVMKREFNIELEDGLIVSIEGHKSIPNENIHWALFVNGDVQTIAADEISLQTSDYIRWSLEDFDEREILK
ncbi:DUF4430 domain-containing protein [Bacillus taeanensis]|uniref:Transcobalamin-like C-terminal domain-containing protein n=1 Tax=Bacillus taeanensis TaxID=273032 RepID=A0A366XZ34_9BACI|nr:DUF4430 domain-containing protein [Bacillus taeanensis]RBW69191.1 hypothetical protein DS031_12460 [Bacillus taeanensis]